MKNYYEGLGIFTALAHALKIEDIIFDNLLSTDGLIALIDLECSLCTKIPFDKKAFYMSNFKAGDLYRDSLIHTGIIPRFTYGGLNNDGESDAALSYIPTRNIVKHKLNDNDPVTKKSSNDYLSAELHIPKLNSQPCLIKDSYE